MLPFLTSARKGLMKPRICWQRQALRQLLKAAVTGFKPAAKIRGSCQGRHGGSFTSGEKYRNVTVPDLAGKRIYEAAHLLKALALSLTPEVQGGSKPAACTEGPGEKGSKVTVQPKEKE